MGIGWWWRLRECNHVTDYGFGLFGRVCGCEMDLADGLADGLAGVLADVGAAFAMYTRRLLCKASVLAWVSVDCL